MAAEGFHEGELAVQSRAGVRAQAARLGGTMLAVPDLNGGISGFLAERDFAVLTARDADGRLWTSALIASAGFLEARDRELTVHAAPGSGDALHGLAEGQAVGLLAIEFATRRRVRVNGTLTYAGTDELQIVVDQAFGNCPKYIQQRRLVHTESDASHRGGTPGFVRVEGARLWWPDYPGNNMFNSLGNLEVDSSAALLFVDFESGASLQISGTAALEWITPGAAGDDGGTGRRVRFTIESVASGHRLGVHSGAPQPSPHNPPTT